MDKAYKAQQFRNYFSALYVKPGESVFTQANVTKVDPLYRKSGTELEHSLVKKSACSRLVSKGFSS